MIRVGCSGWNDKHWRGPVKSTTPSRSLSVAAAADAWVYVRFHGPGGRYFGRYEIARLDTWAARLYEQARAGRDVFAYFNNDPEGMAVVNGQELRALVAARAAAG